MFWSNFKANEVENFVIQVQLRLCPSVEKKETAAEYLLVNNFN